MKNVCILLTIFLLFSCKDNNSKGLVFDAFPSPVELSDYKVLTMDVTSPSHMVVCDSFLFFKDKKENRQIMGVNIKNRETFHFLNTGEGPGETTNLLELYCCTDSVLQAFVDPETCYLYNVHDLSSLPKVVRMPEGQYAYNSAIFMDGKLLYIGKADQTSNNRYCIASSDRVVYSFGAYPVDDQNIKEFPTEGTSKITTYQGKGVVNRSNDRAFFIFTFALGYEVLDLEQKSIIFSKFYQYPQNTVRHIEQLGIFKSEKNIDSYSGFLDLCTDGETIYVLYSGKKFNQDYEYGRHLLTFDWDGNPQNHYILPFEVTAISINKSGKMLFAATAEEESRVIELPLKR